MYQDGCPLALYAGGLLHTSSVAGPPVATAALQLVHRRWYLVGSANMCSKVQHQRHNHEIV